MKDRASSVIVEVADNNVTRGGHILHEQDYNTGHGVSAISNEICREVRRQPCQPEVQQEPVIHLFLEGPLGRDSAVFGLSVLQVMCNVFPGILMDAGIFHTPGDCCALTLCLLLLSGRHFHFDRRLQISGRMKLRHHHSKGDNKPCPRRLYS